MNRETLDRLNRANQQLIESLDALEHQGALTANEMSFGSVIAALIVALLMMLVCAPFGAWIASQRGRSKRLTTAAAYSSATCNIFALELRIACEECSQVSPSDTLPTISIN